VEVEDWFGGVTRRIELDPRRSPQENVERQFDRARKLEREGHGAERELSEARRRVAELEALAAVVRAQEGNPLELEAGAVARGLLEPRQEADPRRRKPAAPRLPYKSFRAAKGSEVRVGRNARDNDLLTLRHCRGGDLWLHTADAPGSHVVLRHERGAVADEEELLDAAHLAVHFSPLRGATRALVHVAPRKLVSKPKGAKPGLVTLAGGRKITVRMQPERLKRVLSSTRPA
jgi:predicted ribosome quality control (RQC) complex YloA/Tae2 family protein